MQVFVPFEKGKAAFLLRELDGGAIGRMADQPHRPGGEAERLFTAITQSKHQQGVGKSGDAKAQAA